MEAEVGESHRGQEGKNPKQQAAASLAEDDDPERSGHREYLLQRAVPPLVLDAVATVQVRHAPVADQAAAKDSVRELRRGGAGATQDEQADRGEDGGKQKPVQIRPWADHPQAHAHGESAERGANKRNQVDSPISWT